MLEIPNFCLGIRLSVEDFLNVCKVPDRVHGATKTHKQKKTKQHSTVTLLTMRTSALPVCFVRTSSLDILTPDFEN